MLASAAADTNQPDAVVTSSAYKYEGAGAQLVTVPRDQFITVDTIMKQDESIESLALDEDVTRSTGTVQTSAKPHVSPVPPSGESV